MKNALPDPTIERLCSLFHLLETLAEQGLVTISSTRLAAISGMPAHTIRKDISCLGEAGRVGAGYDIQRLRAFIGNNLGLLQPRKACLAGLGRIGAAILAYEQMATSGFEIVAGFDSNINRLETLRTTIDLYPAYEIADRVRQKQIELGILAVPAEAAQEVAQRMFAGGIRGIINFTPAIISHAPGQAVSNMDLVRELTIVSAKIKKYSS